MKDKRCNEECRLCMDVKSGDVHGCSCHSATSPIGDGGGEVKEFILNVFCITVCLFITLIVFFDRGPGE